MYLRSHRIQHYDSGSAHFVELDKISATCGIISLQQHTYMYMSPYVLRIMEFRAPEYGWLCVTGLTTFQHAMCAFFSLHERVKLSVQMVPQYPLWHTSTIPAWRSLGLNGANFTAPSLEQGSGCPTGSIDCMERRSTWALLKWMNSIWYWAYQILFLAFYMHGNI